MKRLLLMLPLLFWFGCEHDHATDDTNPLVGVWEMTTASFLIESEPSETITYNSNADNNETMILAEDGIYSSSGVADGDSFSGSGIWSSTSNKLTIVEDGETLIFDFSISGSTLTLIGSGTYIASDIEPGTYTEYNAVITMTYTKS
jgi:hypothetical protein